MKRHSKWLALLLILSSPLFAFSGCGGGEAEHPEEETTKVPAEVQAVIDNVVS